MAIDGFDYEGFSNELANQALELLPAEFQDFQRQYVVNTIKNFANLAGEAIYNDEELGFNAEQGMLVTQIIAEWSFHKSIDVIKSGILPDYWDVIMQKIAFTIFEIAKQAIIQGVSQDETLKIVEHHVKKAYEEVLQELKSRNIINDTVLNNALGQSNIDAMMQQIQEEKQEEEQEQDIQQQAQHPEQTHPQPKRPSDSKILKLASVALLLRQVAQDKVQTILNKFDPNDAATVIQYMQMPDLDRKIDQSITMKCLQEIKTNLPEPKYISPSKILTRMNKVFEKTQKDILDRLISKERPVVKEFVSKAREGECLQMSSKVASIIMQHLEESIT